MATLKIKKEDGTWAFVETAEAVKYTEQILTNEQKIQAKNNIGVTEDLTALKSYIDNKPVTKSDTIKDSDTESTYMTIHYAGEGLESTNWVAAWNPDDPTQIKAIKPSKLLKTVGYWNIDESGLIYSNSTNTNNVRKISRFYTPETHEAEPSWTGVRPSLLIDGSVKTWSNNTQTFCGDGFMVDENGRAYFPKFTMPRDLKDVGVEEPPHDGVNTVTISYIYTANGIGSLSLDDQRRYADQALPTVGYVYEMVQTNDYPCLAAGTPINMADGTYRNIEDIKPGDEVLSYDPRSNELTPTIVVAAYKTGETRNFNVYNFSNGASLLAYGHHGIYSPRLGQPVSLEDMKLGEEVYNSQKEKVSLMTIKETIISGPKTARYNLLTLNNLYFANDILLGNRPTNKLHYFLDRGIELPENIQAHWQLDVDDYNVYNEVLRNNNYYTEIKEPMSKFSKARDLIKSYKNKLNETDYKSQKRLENLIGDEEWNENTKRRNEWRAKINEQEIVHDENFEKIKAIRKKYFGENGEPKAIFEKCCSRAHDIYDIAKEYFSKKEEE